MKQPIQRHAWYIYSGLSFRLKIRINKYRYKYWYHTWIILDHCLPLPYPDLNPKKNFGSVPIFLWCQSLQASPPFVSSNFPNMQELFHHSTSLNLFCVWLFWPTSLGRFYRFLFGVSLEFSIGGTPPWPPPGPWLPKASQGHHPSSPRFGCLWHHRQHPSRLRPARYCWWLKSGDHQLRDR